MDRRSVVAIVENRAKLLKEEQDRELQFQKEQLQELKASIQNPRKTIFASPKEEKANPQIQTTISANKDEIKEIRRTYNSKLQALQEHFDQLKQLYEEKSTEWGETKQGLEAEVGKLSTQLRNSEQQKLDLKEQLQSQQKLLEDFQTSISESTQSFRTQIKSMEEALRQEQNKNAELSKELTNKTKEITEDYQAKLAALKEDVLEDNKLFQENNQETLDKLSAKQDASSNSLKAFSNVISALQDEIRELKRSRPSRSRDSRNVSSVKKPPVEKKKTPSTPTRIPIEGGTTKYSASPRKGVFYTTKLTDSPVDGHYFVLSINEASNQGSFTIIDDPENIRSASNYLDAVIIPSSEIIGTPKPGELFRVISPGSIVFDGNNWKIKEKMKVQF